MNKKGAVLWMRILGAGISATGFVMLGVGGYNPTLFGQILIGVGAALIAGGT